VRFLYMGKPYLTCQTCQRFGEHECSVSDPV
jgi:hypothetical protein